MQSSMLLFEYWWAIHNLLHQLVDSFLLLSIQPGPGMFEPFGHMTVDFFVRGILLYFASQHICNSGQQRSTFSRSW